LWELTRRRGKEAWKTLFRKKAMKTPDLEKKPKGNNSWKKGMNTVQKPWGSFPENLAEKKETERFSTRAPRDI